MTPCRPARVFPETVAETIPNVTPAGRQMPNLTAYVVLFSFPLLAYVLFRKLPLRKALIYTILGGYLFLPDRTGFDLPLLPMVDKGLVPSLAAIAFSAMVLSDMARKARLVERARRKLAPATVAPVAEEAPPPPRFVSARHMPETAEPAPIEEEVRPDRSLWITALVLVCICSPLLTMMTNREALFYGPTVLPGLTLGNAYTMVSSAVSMLLPFFLARRFLGNTHSHELILRILCYFALVMSLLILIEVRLSPQLNIWIYGFMPHSFHQHVRAGGYRPMLFLHHGLWVGIIISMSVVAALTLFKNSTGRARWQWLAVSVWLFITLVLCKTIGALVIGVLLGAVVLFMPRRAQLLVAGIFAATVALYPMLRSTGLAPVQQVYELAESYSADRAQSFKFRLDNEDLLLTRANEKPLTGWGSYSRPSIFDPITGDQTSVVDGAWVIIMGVSGWIGYLSQFGLLCLPIIMLALSWRQGGIPLVTTGMVVMMTANLIDLIPNATLTPLTWLLAGSMAGYYDLITTRRKSALSPTDLRRRGLSAPAELGTPVTSRRQGRA